MNILQKILFFVFLLFFSLPVLGQDIHIENGWNFASGSAFYFSWIDSSLTKNFIVEVEFGNHQHEFWQYVGTFVDNGFYYISVGWLKDVDNFIVPDSIVVYLKTGEISNTTDRILMTMGLQYGDHNWSWLGDQQKEITPLWERYCFDMTWVKTFMDSVSIVYMYFTFMTEEGVDSCYIGGGLLGDDLLGKNGNTFFLIDGFVDDTITRVEVT